MTITLTKEQRDFLVMLLDQLTIKPTSEDAITAVKTIQEIRTALEA